MYAVRVSPTRSPATGHAGDIGIYKVTYDAAWTDDGFDEILRRKENWNTAVFLRSISPYTSGSSS